MTGTIKDILRGNFIPPTLEELRNAYRQQSIYGSGGNATVFEIPNYPDLLLKVDDWRDKNVPPEEPVLLDQSIFEGRNFGQPVAQVAPGITVLVKQKGVPAGINGKQRHSVNADALYEASLERAAALPPAAYECLVEDVMFLHEREKAIDPSKPGNVLIDLENGRFNFVDIGQGKAYPEDIESLYVMLTTRGYGYKGNNAETVREMKQQIMDKLITAYETLQLPGFERPSFDIQNFVEGAEFDPATSENFVARLEMLQNAPLQGEPEIKGPTNTPGMDYG